MPNPRFLAHSLFLVALGACGGAKQSPTSPIIEETSKDAPLFGAADGWKVVSKSCDGQALTEEPGETYKLGENQQGDYLVRVNTVSEDEHTICKAGYFYHRVITFAGWDGTTYHENAILRSFVGKENAKKSCWAKATQSTEATLISEEFFSFGPEELNVKMAAPGGTITLELQGAESCPNGTTILVLGAKPL